MHTLKATVLFILILASSALATMPQINFTKVAKDSPTNQIAQAVFAEEYKLMKEWPGYNDDTLYEGRFDLNEDGTDELLIVFAHMLFQGTAGTKIFVAQQSQNGKWKRSVLTFPHTEYVPLFTGKTTHGYLNLVFGNSLWTFNGKNYEFSKRVKMSKTEAKLLPIYQ